MSTLKAGAWRAMHRLSPLSVIFKIYNRLNYCSRNHTSREILSVSSAGGALQVQWNVWYVDSTKEKFMLVCETEIHLSKVFLQIVKAIKAYDQNEIKKQ